MISRIKHEHDTGAYLYASRILEGKENVGKAMRLAAERFMNDLTRDDIYLDLEACRKIINYTELCRHHKGSKAGMPITLDPHQPFFFQQIFGWKYKETNLRRTRRVFKLIARKEYKTTELAIGGTFHNLVEEPNGPQFAIGATKEEQAKICVNDAAMIIRKSPALREHFKMLKHGKYYHTIMCHKTDGIIYAISKESDKEDGLDISMAGIDEWHGHKNTSVRDILRSAMGNRHGLEWIISTAGFDLMVPCYQQTRKIAYDILEGRVEDDEQLAFLYEIDDPEKNWENEKFWEQSNPSMPYSSTKLSNLRTQYKVAKNEGGSSIVNFKTKDLNIWTESSEIWLPNEVWIANHDPRFEEKELLGEKCWGGLDLAQTRDLNSFVLEFEVELWGRTMYPVLNWNWLPEDNVKYRGANYKPWADQGFIKLTPGNHSDPSMMRDDIAEKSEMYNIQRIHYDRYLAEWLGPMLAELGILMCPRSMGGYALTQSMKEMERKVLARQYLHFMNPVMKWANSNLNPKRDHNGNIRPDKSDPKKKIDPIVGLILAEDARIHDEAEETNEGGIIGLEW